MYGKLTVEKTISRGVSWDLSNKDMMKVVGK